MESQEAADFYYSWMQHKDAFLICLTILNNYDDLYSNFASLNVLNSLVSNKWFSFNKQQKDELKETLYLLLNDEREQPIINMSAKLIAEIAVNEFPEVWDNFLFDCLSIGNSLILIYYLEEILNNIYYPQYRRILVYNKILNCLNLILNAIFNRTDITPSSLHLFSLLGEWVPIGRLLNKQNLKLLTNSLLLNSQTKNEAIDCLNTIFVKRCDSTDDFFTFHYTLLTNLYQIGLHDRDCAELLADIITSHFHFFSTPCEKKEIIDVPIEEEELDEDVLVINIGSIKKQTKQIETITKQFLFYDTHKDCFQLLINPGWANEPSKYWSIWHQLFIFADNLNCDISNNHILSWIPSIFFQMYSIILTIFDEDDIINTDALQCFHIMMKYEKKFILDFFDSQEFSISLLSAIACCFEKMNQDERGHFISLILTLNIDFEILDKIVLCLSIILQNDPDNFDLCSKFSEFISNGLNPSVEGYEIKSASIFSLKFLSSRVPQVFFSNDSFLLNISISLIPTINPLFYNDPIIKAFFSVIASIIVIIDDPIQCEDYLNFAMNGAISFLISNYQDIFSNSEQNFEIFIKILDIFNEFTKRCFKFALLKGTKILDIICFFIMMDLNNNNKLNILTLHKYCYELSISILTARLDSEWSYVEQYFYKILTPALSGNSSHFGFALKFLTAIRRKFPESGFHLFSVFKSILTPLMTEITVDSQYVLEYLYVSCFWDFSFELPLNFMKVVVKDFPFLCTSPALSIVQQYCLHYLNPIIRKYMIQEGENVFRFLTTLLFDSFYNDYFKQIVKAFMAYFTACAKLEFQELAIKQSMLKVLNEVLPDVYKDDENETYEEVAYRKEKERLFVSFIEFVTYNFHDYQTMENGFRSLIISLHCSHPTSDSLFNLRKSNVSHQINPVISELITENGDEITFTEDEINAYFD